MACRRAKYGVSIVSVGAAPSNGAVVSASSLVDPTAAEHGALGLRTHEVRRVDGQQVTIPDDEVGELTRLEAALDSFLERGVRAVHRGAADRLLDRDALIRTPGVATGIGTGDLRAQPEHRLRRARRVIRPGRRLDAGVQEI